jgi:pimeloyl-ACP methyl ester carboxylesterase
VIPQTAYARSGGVSIAYQVAGSGPVDLLVVPGWVSNVEQAWEDPDVGAFLRRLASFSPLLLMDRRGTGLSDRVGRLGLALRAGIHTGECQIAGGKVTGLAVHVGARVAAAAPGGEVWVSRTVKDLVACAALRFADRGHHVVKGVPEAWRLFAVAS